MNQPLVVAITGASGVIYGVRLVQVLLRSDRQVHLTISPAGQEVIAQELNRRIDLDDFRIESLVDDVRAGGNLCYHHYRDLLAPIASGSHRTSGMAICPCSGSTMSAVAHASGSNLIHRAADVHLKERRKLVLVPRETPVSLPQLDNMRRACEAGAVILPASPGWYHGVQSPQDLVDFIVARILDHLGVGHELVRRWGEQGAV